MVSSRAEKLTDYALYFILACIGIIAVFPLLFVVSVSLTPYTEVLKNGGYVLIPRSVTLNAYHYLFTETAIPRSIRVTVFLTAAGTLINLVGITSVAYPLSRKNLPGRSMFLLYILFTMLFSGGLVPTYLIVKQVGLLNTLWAMIIPGAIVTFHVLIMKSFFENLPNELFESARMDGAKETVLLLRILLPMSIPVVLTIGLFNMVAYWNTFFSAIIYITNRELHPLQVIVRNLLLEANQVDEIVNVDDFVPTVTMNMAAVVIASLPMIIVYPFIQKHFAKGMLLGAIKG